MSQVYGVEVPEDRYVFLKEKAAEGLNLRKLFVEYHKKRFPEDGLIRMTTYALRVYVEQAVQGVEPAIKVVQSSSMCHEIIRRLDIKVPFELPDIEGAPPSMEGTEYVDPGYGPINKDPK